MPSEHAKLSPSAAERWLECPASIRMEAKVPEEVESEYAAEGTAAHALGEIKVSLEFGLISSQAAKRARAAWEREHLSQLEKWDLAEMERHTDAYVELVKDRVAEHPGSRVLVEQRMDSGVPNCWGTSDIVILHSDFIEIVDFKYGQGVRVDAEGNPQLRLYALGALETFSVILGEPEEVRISVFQPRLEHFDSETLHPEDLRRWRDKKVIPIAIQALGDNAPFGPSETACRWCPASGMCKAQLEEVFRTDFETDPEQLTPEDIATELARIPLIKQWLSKFEEAALDRAYSHSVEIPGYKVVISGGRRAVNDPVGLQLTLEGAGYDKEEFTTTKPVGIGELEKLLGKDNWHLVEPYIKKGEGKPSLVPEDDKRSAASPNTEAKKEFGSL